VNSYRIGVTPSSALRAVRLQDRSVARADGRISLAPVTREDAEAADRAREPCWLNRLLAGLRPFARLLLGAHVCPV
jgi:hypothetical protein